MLSSMKIAELSRRTGAPMATLKYYLREGLLPPGESTAVNQAEYGDAHVRRVKLIRALVELGRLSIADVRSVLEAVDDDSVPLHAAFGTAQDAMVPKRARDGERYEAALAEVDRFVRRHRLAVRPDAAVRCLLADALVWLGEFGWGSPSGAAESAMFDAMLPRILADAAAEIAFVPADAERGEQVEFSVVGTVAFEVAGDALRRMALEHASAKRFGRMVPSGRTRKR
jgi:DNA-binding transcriptional MerR regulator